MKNNRIKSERWWYFGLVLISIFMNVGCQEVDTPEGELRCQVEAVAGEEDVVVGKWKMIKKTEFNFTTGSHTTDHSCDNIIYYFREDGHVKVESDVEGIPYNTGDNVFPYELKFSLIHETMEDYTTLRIGNIRWPCKIEKRNMTLNLAYVDGPTLNFVRIQ